jgi:hypothetical protein
MTDGPMFILVSLGGVFAIFIFIPWVAIGLEAYWSWCLKIQRKLRDGRQQ